MPNIYQNEAPGPVPDTAAIFAALGDVTRLEIISSLQDGSDRSISQLAEGFSITRQGVSRHLRVLENARLVSCRHVGRETRYRLEVEILNQARDHLVRASERWDDAIDRLAKHLGC